MKKLDNSDDIVSKNKTKTRTVKNKTISASSSDSGLEKTQNDEYADYDTSDEEDIRNTVGNIPMNWYDEYKHMGYDWDGKAIGKPESGDHLDNFLKRMEDPDFWRTVKDPQTGQDVVLSEEDIQIIQRLKAGKIPDVTFEEYAVGLVHTKKIIITIFVICIFVFVFNLIYVDDLKLLYFLIINLSNFRPQKATFKVT